MGRTVNDLERTIFALPARHAGLGIFNPCVQSGGSIECSQRLSGPLTTFIVNQERFFDPAELKAEQNRIKKAQKIEADKKHEETLVKIEEIAPAQLKLAIKLAREKGSSNWVTAMPLHSHSTVLHKSDFRDAIHIRYGWTSPRLPEKCGCGGKFSVEHALECMTGGFRGLLQ